MLPLDSQCCKACLACHSRTKSRPYILLESLRCHVNEKKIIKITKILVLHLFVNVLYSCHLPYLSESYLSLYPSWLGTCGSPPASASQSIGHCAQSPGRNGLLSIFLELCVPFLNLWWCFLNSRWYIRVVSFVSFYLIAFIVLSELFCFNISSFYYQYLWWV